VRYLTVKNLKDVWAEFSTLGWAVLLYNNVNVHHAHNHIEVENSAQICRIKKMGKLEKDSWRRER
jgi:hypothetical protein